jgi:hypothetical protein
MLSGSHRKIPGVDLKDTSKRYGAALVTQDGFETWTLCTIESDSGETVQARHRCDAHMQLPTLVFSSDVIHICADS